MNNRDYITPLRLAVTIFGKQSKLAERINPYLSNGVRSVEQASVSKWINRDKRTPAQYCIAIEEATKGFVTRYQLRPDVFGEAPPPVE